MNQPLSHSGGGQVGTASQHLNRLEHLTAPKGEPKETASFKGYGPGNNG